jgi:hypothetical protein
MKQAQTRAFGDRGDQQIGQTHGPVLPTLGQ